MKTHLFTITVLICLSLSCIAQNQPKSARTGKNAYELNSNTQVTAPDGTSRIAARGLKFNILSNDEAGYLITFLKITASSDPLKGDNTYVNSDNDGVNYIISSSDFENNAFLRGKIITTTLILPLKLRFKLGYESKTIPFTAVSDVTVGPLLGYRVNLDKASDFTTALTFGAFAGPTLINVNSSNVHNPDKINPDGENNINNILGFSFGGAIVFQLKEFQIGAVYGWDYATGDMGANWVYDQKPWASIAIGYRFLEK